MKKERPTYSTGYIERLKSFEGFRSKAYKPKGEKSTAYYTIGYGHYGITDANKVITEVEATDLLYSDLQAVNRELYAVLGSSISERLSVNKWTALVDFVFNLGIGSFKRSTLCKLIKYDIKDSRIPNEFLRWVYSGDKRLPGLEVRRRYERNLWLENNDGTI